MAMTFTRVNKPKLTKHGKPDGRGKHTNRGNQYTVYTDERIRMEINQTKLAIEINHNTNHLTESWEECDAVSCTLWRQELIEFGVLKKNKTWLLSGLF